jgi:hypothetical protein
MPFSLTKNPMEPPTIPPIMIIGELNNEPMPTVIKPIATQELGSRNLSVIQFIFNLQWFEIGAWPASE